MSNDARVTPEPAATDQPATFDEVLGVLREVGQAWRGDWSLDGRAGRGIIDDLVAELDHAHRTGAATKTVYGLRAGSPLCDHGLGHWNDYCDDDCERVAAERAQWPGV